MDPDAVQRLDDAKTILQVRSGYGAILNKLNFYSDDRFVSRRQAVAPFCKDLQIPDLTPRAERPLFTPRPAELKPAGEITVFQLDQGDEHDAAVASRARDVFADPSPFIHAYHRTVEATGDEAITELLLRLRTAPHTIGRLRGDRSLFGRKGRRERRAALDAVWPLREAMVAARWDVVRQRLDTEVPPSGLYFAPGSRPAIDTDIAGEAVEADEDEDNRLELSFEDGNRILGAISNLVSGEIRDGRVTDANALARALDDICVGFQQSMTDITENNRLASREEQAPEQERQTMEACAT